jgi:hypothetical protein
VARLRRAISLTTTAKLFVSFTNQYFLGQLGYIRELLKLPPLLGSDVEFIGLYEAGKTYKLPLGPKPPNLPMDGAAGIIVNTIFGPVEVAGAVGNYWPRTVLLPDWADLLNQFGDFG